MVFACLFCFPYAKLGEIEVSGFIERFLNRDARKEVRMGKTVLPFMACALLMCQGCFAQKAQDGFKSITMEEAGKFMREEKDFILLDVRTKAEYDGGHIPGAVLLPNEEIQAGGNPGAAVTSLLPDKDRTILVYCRSGNRSKQASAKLAEAGYSRIIEIGGINSWTGPVEK